jgi:hypothetical protein
MPNESGSDIMKVGDYKLIKLTIQSLITNSRVDISRLFKSIEIYEDMFAPYLSAKLYIEDGLNWPEKLPITGQERVELIFKTDVDDIEPTSLVFRVYRLDSQEIDDRGESQTYTLHLITEGAYLNYSQQCGYAVAGTSSDIVRKIFTKHFPNSVWSKKLQIEDTTDNYSFVLPKSYTPFKAINWLSSKAINKTGKQYSPYFFYETLDGYCFKSLFHIIKEGLQDILPYFYTSPNIPTSATTSPYYTILPAGHHRIQKLKEVDRFDMLENIMYGTVSSLLTVHDLLRKQKRNQIFREADVFSDKTKLGVGVHFRETDPEASRLIKNGSGFFFLPSTPYTAYTDSNPIIDNTQVEKTFLPRNYHINSILTQKIVIDIFGDNRKRVGQVIKIFVPKISADGHLQDDKADENLSGNFLITAVKHTLNTVYSCTLELSRNCMGVE